MEVAQIKSMEAVTKLRPLAPLHEGERPVAPHSPVEARLRLYLAAAGVEHEPVTTHTVRRLLNEATRLHGEATVEAVMRLVIDHHHGMPVTRPASPAGPRRAMKPRRMRSVFALLGRLARWKAVKLREHCERAQQRHVRPSHSSE